MKKQARLFFHYVFPSGPIHHIGAPVIRAFKRSQMRAKVSYISAISHRGVGPFGPEAAALVNAANLSR